MDGVIPQSSFPRALAERFRAALPVPLFMAVAYYAGCLAGFTLRFPDSGISFFWPPTAVLTAALILISARSWSVVLAASFAAHAIAHAQNGVPAEYWPVQFLGNTVQAVLAALVVRRYSGATLLFADLYKVLTFIVGACVLAPALASLIPAYGYVAMGWASDFAEAWRVRTISNAIAMLTIVPSLVFATLHVRSRRLEMPAAPLEYLLLLSGLTIVHAAVESIGRADAFGLTALYAPVPFLLWATIRFGAPGLSFALLWTTVLLISATLQGAGPFAVAPAADAVVGVQLVIVVTAVPMMLIAGLLEQYRTQHRILVDVEQQNSAILRALPDSIFLLTRDGVYLQHYARAAGDSAAIRQSFVGRNMHDVLPPEMAEAFSQAFDCIGDDEPAVIEFGCRIDDETRRYEGRFIRLEGDRILTIVRDITERWRSERALRETQQRYALATSAGGIGVWELDLASGAILLEGNLRALLGYGEGEIGNRLTDWQQVVHPADRQRLHAQLLSFIAGISSTFEVECRLMHSNGSDRWIAGKGAITDSVGNVRSRARGTYADITERKEAARALSDASDALVRTGRIAAMAELSATVAHELNQPLTAIATNASACLRSLDSKVPMEIFRSALTDMLHDSRRASHILERTQEMFTNRPVQKAALDLGDVVRDVLHLAEPRLREFDVHLEFALESQRLPVLADAVQIQQVLLNLIVNGVDAMQHVSERPRVLRISSRRCRRVALVSVRDSGTGMQADTATRVFEPFFTTKPAGTGMGLAISRSIITGHRGRMWLVANVDAGTTFRFTIPLLDADAADASASGASSVTVRRQR
jgi:PAS domain S-box-containing protein